MLPSATRVLLLVSLVAACARRDAAPADTAPAVVPYAYERLPLDTARSPGSTIDSVFPMPEMMRRFREGLPVIDTLASGAASREALVTAFVAALAARDTRTLGQLTLSRAEFAYLYAPHAPELTRANGLPPQRLWDQVTLASEKGIARALARVGGQALALERTQCVSPAITLGPVRLHTECTVHLRLPDGSAFDGQLFGSILEHGGRFKFTGYANDM